MRRSMLGIMAAAAVALAAHGAAHAGALAPGTPLPALTLADQHGESTTVGPGTRLLLFTRDMEASKVTKAALLEDGEGLLARARALYVSDVAGMPSLVTRLFAIPAMKRRSYRMLLDRDGTATAAFPSEVGKVTLIHLDEGVVTRVEYVGAEVMLRKELRAAAAAAAAAGDGDAAAAPAE